MRYIVGFVLFGAVIAIIAIGSAPERLMRRRDEDGAKQVIQIPTEDPDGTHPVFVFPPKPE